ncbi:hypothetical protein D9M71_477090 [compost metagenome]
MPLPFSATVPRPVAGWVRPVMLSGTSPSASLSLSSTLMLTGTPKLVLALSGLATGAWLGTSSGALPTTTTASVSAPPAADFTVTTAGGWARSVTRRLCRVPALVMRPNPWAARSGICTSSLELASMVSERSAQE